MNAQNEDSGFDIVSHSAEETIEIGSRIGAVLKGGEVIAVSGALGSGKTHLIKGIAAGAGAADAARVNSPTFVIVNEYRSDEGRLDVYHIDAYRIESSGEFEMLGFDEFCRPDSVVVIEWADKVEQSLQGIECLRIEMSHVDESRRRVVLTDVPKYILIGLK